MAQELAEGAEAVPAAVACGAVGSYLWSIRRSQGVILDTLREAGERLPGDLSSGIAWGAWAAALAAALSLAACVAGDLLREREDAPGERTRRRR